MSSMGGAGAGRDSGPSSTGGMSGSNPAKLKKSHIVCTMRPLRLCIEENTGDMSRCKKEVEEFERTCDKRLEYVHDRDGLDDTRTGMFSGQKDRAK
mmetsp:Transcript_75250/g.121498  ORF Transcript_75250/g.121498 Transcript_75250/m.121498 type:complete len:96 (-) Transcript_75250:203-490(-)|eukprot:CAMPEP_0115090026 /NCGR_PEP_ID=MMETSP0227-20121206/25121_1 /TAXON_ID=89957 /ORGANISM="Polarella glacialis, Strain CCMP 1383" /LENGTH=95 /DNA_ID=CAMNT_0002480967 /DNA_START=51 /DNA_END=338 /DNA_ORIENTATION=-